MIHLNCKIYISHYNVALASAAAIGLPVRFLGLCDSSLRGGTTWCTRCVLSRVEVEVALLSLVTAGIWRLLVYLRLLHYHHFSALLVGLLLIYRHSSISLPLVLTASWVASKLA